MVKNLAKQAMTTRSQKICFVLDHLVEALGGDPSSSLRRALILADIDQYPGTTQTGVMERLRIHKSALTREIEWMFNYGCIVRSEADNDGRAVKLHTYGYSKAALQSALDYFKGSHEQLKSFINEFTKAMKQEKPSLRDAKIIAILSDRKVATKQEVLDSLYNGSASTDNRSFNELVEQGLIEDAV